MGRSYSHFDFLDGMVLDLQRRSDGGWNLCLSDPLDIDQLINIRITGELTLILDPPTEGNRHHASA